MTEPPHSPETAPAIRAWLLGPATIEIDGRALPVLDWPRRAARSLILMLLGTPGHRVSRDLVVETLWPDLAPENAANALYKTIHWLRREIEPKLADGRSSAYLVLNADFVALAPGLDIWIDAEQFERWMMTRSNSPEARRAALRQSLQLYRGDFLVDEPYLDWPAARRESLKTLATRSARDRRARSRGGSSRSLVAVARNLDRTRSASRKRTPEVDPLSPGFRSTRFSAASLRSLRQVAPRRTRYRTG